MREVEERFARLASKKRRGSPPQVEDLESFIAALTVNDLTGLLRRCTVDKGRLEAVSRYSYIHANGFSKLTLMRVEGLNLRAHLWHADGASAENIHGHRWPFASRVVSGSLTEERFIVAQSDKESVVAREHLYEVANLDRPGTFTPGKVVRLQRLESICHSEGSTYSMGTQELHRVLASDAREPSVTVVVTGPSTRRGSPVFGIENRAPVPDVKSHSMTPATVRQVVAEVREILS